MLKLPWLLVESPFFSQAKERIILWVKSLQHPARTSVTSAKDEGDDSITATESIVQDGFGTWPPTASGQFFLHGKSMEIS